MTTSMKQQLIHILVLILVLFQQRKDRRNKTGEEK